MGQMRDPLATRVVGAVVGAFYLVTGAWAFLAPMSFFSSVATFAPLNIHLLHDVGAFQVGLGLALTAPVALRAPLRASLIAVLGASLLHVLAQLSSSRLRLGNEAVPPRGVPRYPALQASEGSPVLNPPSIGADGGPDRRVANFRTAVLNSNQVV